MASIVFLNQDFQKISKVPWYKGLTEEILYHKIDATQTINTFFGSATQHLITQRMSQDLS